MQLHLTKHPSGNVMNFRHLLGRDTIEDIGFIKKYQSGFRQNKSTDDHPFMLSQSVMESFNWGEHVVAAFLDVEEAFDNVWHNGLRSKFSCLTFSLK